MNGDIWAFPSVLNTVLVHEYFIFFLFMQTACEGDFDTTNITGFLANISDFDPENEACFYPMVSDEYIATIL
jgi:hypothetical protein